MMDKLKELDAASTQEVLARVVAEGLTPLKQWGEGRLIGNPASRTIWDHLFATSANAIADALVDAGYALVKMGGHFPVQVGKRSSEHGYHTEFRVQVEVRPAIIWCSETVGEPLASDPEFRQHNLPRILARSLSRHIEGLLAEDIAQAFYQEKSDA